MTKATGIFIAHSKCKKLRNGLFEPLKSQKKVRNAVFNNTKPTKPPPFLEQKSQTTLPFQAL
jgi:hypothetical protein